MKRDQYSSKEEALRKLLRSRRIEVGLSQESLAAKLDTHQSFVSKYESGERLLTFVETIDICKTLGLEPGNLLKKYLSHLET